MRLRHSRSTAAVRSCSLVAIFGATYLAMLPAGAHAEGAIALGVPDDVAKQGLAFGRSWNVPNVDDAKQRAMEECKTVQGAPPATRKLCKVVATYENQCAAIALDNKAGTPGWGYAIGDTKEEAEEGALRNCQKTAGTERQKFCELGNTRCDGKPTAEKKPTHSDTDTTTSRGNR